MRSRLWTIIGPLGLVVMTLGFVGFTEPAPSASDPSEGQKSEQRQTDEIIRAKIEKRLLMDDRIDWKLLQVEVNQGHAILYGEVRTPQEKGVASLITSTVRGVKGLTNSIIIEPAMTKDHKLANAVWNVLKGVPALSGNDTLKVNVKNAVVKLEGMVEQSIQKQTAEKAAQSVLGVTTVINLIEVKGKASGGNVPERVREKMLQEGVELQP